MGIEKCLTEPKWRLQPKRIHIQKHLNYALCGLQQGGGDKGKGCTIS